nr:MAG TPA: Intrinsic membrane protein PufX [Caudoviricetes sp.]
MNKLKGLYYFVSLVLLVVTLIYRLSKTAKRSDILEQLKRNAGIAGVMIGIIWWIIELVAGVSLFVFLIKAFITLSPAMNQHDANLIIYLEQLASYIDFVWISFILLYVYDFIVEKLVFVMGGEV